MVGNTSSGVFKDFKPSVFIDIHNIPELKVVSECSILLLFFYYLQRFILGKFGDIWCNVWCCCYNNRYDTIINKVE